MKKEERRIQKASGFSARSSHRPLHIWTSVIRHQLPVPGTYRRYHYQPRLGSESALGFPHESGYVWNEVKNMDPYKITKIIISFLCKMVFFLLKFKELFSMVPVIFNIEDLSWTRISGQQMLIRNPASGNDSVGKRRKTKQSILQRVRSLKCRTWFNFKTAEFLFYNKNTGICWQEK